LDDFGQRVRVERLKRKMTLNQLAEISSLSVSFLSEIERNVSRPSLSSMRKISQSLDISLVSFMSGGDCGDPVLSEFSLIKDQNLKREKYIKDVRIVRANQRKKLCYPDSDNYYELLTPNLNRQLQVLYSQAKPGVDSGPPIIDPPGEKFLHILKGNWEYTIDGEKYCLNQGDSIYYPADLPISWRLLGEEPGETMLVITPPGF